MIRDGSMFLWLGRFRTSVLLVLVAAVVWFMPARWGVLDDAGDAFFARALPKAVVVYGAARLVNKVVSIPQEGAPFGTGQILDPLNDATERLSEVATVSIMVLMLMKLATELLIPLGTKLLSLALLAMAFSMVLARSGRARRAFEYVAYALVALVLLRVSLPLAGAVDSHLMDHYFSPRVDRELETFRPLEEKWKENMEGMRKVWASMGKFGVSRPSKKSGLMSWTGLDKVAQLLDAIYGTIKGVVKTVTLGGGMVWELGRFLMDHTDEAIASIVNLMGLMVAMTVLQVFLVPLAVWWFLRGLLRTVMEPSPTVVVADPESAL